jgi:hypothetical protein
MLRRTAEHVLPDVGTGPFPSVARLGGNGPSCLTSHQSSRSKRSISASLRSSAAIREDELPNGLSFRV